MAAEYSVEVCRRLEEKFRSSGLHRPMQVGCYDAGTELVYDVKGVEQAVTARVHLVVEKFVGGGFAGQVYRVKVLNIEAEDGPIDSLQPGRVYAMKILIPPSNFSRLFRNMLYWVGFQGPFQLQVNPTAARAGALWQKFIRRGAKIRFGDERTIVDIYATFVDNKLGSCGELSEWVDGRTWRLEVDDRLDSLKRWRRGKVVDAQQLGSPEYRAKREFMGELVRLLYGMGGYEFARQYEWWTYKSQPNCLKRRDTEDNPSGGLVAVDFRAGLALLPFLPMSPGDFKLIVKGLMRGSLVQFDRGNTDKLERFAEANSDEFSDMHQMLEELKAVERLYRDSIPDITHNHVRLLYSPRLWSTMLDSAVTGWKVRNLVDERYEQKLRNSRTLTLLFFVVGLIPFLGRLVRRIWARPDWRKHYQAILTNWDYLRRAVQARIAEKVIVWHRAGRLDGERAQKVAGSFWRFLGHFPLSILFVWLHRFLTDWDYAKERLVYIFVRPVRLYFSSRLREQWMRDMVEEGKKKNILTDDDAETILSQLSERYIQRYLISLVVHLLTLPVTQAVFFLIGLYVKHITGSTAKGVFAFAVGQVIPISPGSICRGIWAVGLAIHDRDFKNYNIAVFLSFVKYIGYLAFPIQMTHRYPALARFMAAHWATGAVHIVPVFGETGALLEHWVFRLFYNWPLTIRRRMRKRAEMRASMKPRYWHVGLCAIAAAGIFGLWDFACLMDAGRLPSLRDIWWLVVVVPFLCGAGVTLGCGGARLWKRIVAATICGIAFGVLYTAVSAILVKRLAAGDIAAACVWRVFVFAVLSTVGAMATELKLPEPELENSGRKT